MVAIWHYQNLVECPWEIYIVFHIQHHRIHNQKIIVILKTWKMKQNQIEKNLHNTEHFYRVLEGIMVRNIWN